MAPVLHPNYMFCTLWGRDQDGGCWLWIWIFMAQFSSMSCWAHLWHIQQLLSGPCCVVWICLSGGFLRVELIMRHHNIPILSADLLASLTYNAPHTPTLSS